MIAIPGGRGSANSRNGSTPKTLSRRDDHQFVCRRDDDPRHPASPGPHDRHRLSPDTISKITDGVLEEVREWQSRPLEGTYPIIYLDALVVKVRDGHHVRNRSAPIAVGVDLDGVNRVLGIWVQAIEGAKFWAGVCAELRNREIRDVLIVCCDGLTGFPDAIEATWDQATVQTCTVRRCGSCPTRSQEGRRGTATDLYRPDRRCGRGGPRGVRSLRTRSQVPGQQSRPGVTPGNGSSRSWPSRPSCARSSTRPTRLSR